MTERKLEERYNKSVALLKYSEINAAKPCKKSFIEGLKCLMELENMLLILFRN